MAAVTPDSGRFVNHMGWRGDAACKQVCWLLGLAGLTAWPMADAVAQVKSEGAAGPCRFETAGTGKVAKILDGRNFLLADGREIRLAGIEVPFLPSAGESGARAEAGRAARAALVDLIGGQTVELRRNGAAADRYGRLLAHAYFTADDGRELSAAHEMLGRGFAQVGPQVGDRACAEDLWARERTARAGKLGLWGEPYYVVMGAQRLAEQKAEPGQFSVVEGKVLSVRESGGTIYMNFGRKWSEALTVTISKRNERNFAAAGVDVRRLENRLVRVRGYIEERNGPRIEASRPEQIEIAERN
jgi:endonuclease YncB( thermonuclease family)